MPKDSHTDLTFLAARLHGRRSRAAEGERLDELCALSNVPELSRKVLGGIEIATAPELQRDPHATTHRRSARAERPHPGCAARPARLGASSIHRLQSQGAAPGGCSIGSTGTRSSRTSSRCPGSSRPWGPCLPSSKSVRELVDLVPLPALREPLARVLRSQVAQGHPFFFEAALDQAWLQGMMKRAAALASEDAELVSELVAQEARIFHLMLVLRGRAQQGLDPAALLPWRLELGPAEKRRLVAAAADPRNQLLLAAGSAADVAGRGGECVESLPASGKPRVSTQPDGAGSGGGLHGDSKGRACQSHHRVRGDSRARARAAASVQAHSRGGEPWVSGTGWESGEPHA